MRVTRRRRLLCGLRRRRRRRSTCAALLAAARGAPPLICGLAAQSIGNGNWGWWSDVPASPLGAAARPLDSDRRGLRDLPDADVTRLLDALASDDACVREMSVRLVGHQEETRVAAPLISKLSSPDASLRTVAALGLGLVEPQRAVDPLIGTLRDATAEVRANSAWALGRIENGRALAPLTGLFRDGSPLVREAAVAAVGRFESTSAVAALLRVLQEDQVASVRRVAAWALGHLESRESAQALATVLARESDRARARDDGMGARPDRAAGGIGGAAARAARGRGRRACARRQRGHWRRWRTAPRSPRSSRRSVIAARRVRGTAAWALGQMSDDDARGQAPAALTRLLKDDSEDVRRKAAWALGNVGDASAVPAIRDAMRVEQSSEVRTGARARADEVRRPLGGGVHRAAVVERSEGARGGGARSGRTECVQSVAVAVAAPPAVPVSAPMFAQAIVVACGLALCEPTAPAGAPSVRPCPGCGTSLSTDSIRAVTVRQARNATRDGAWNAAADMWRDALLLDDRTGTRLARAWRRAARGGASSRGGGGVPARDPGRRTADDARDARRGASLRTDGQRPPGRALAGTGHPAR